METIQNTNTLFQVAEVELSYKSSIKNVDRPKVSNSREVYNLLLANWDKTKIEYVEQFKILLLNRANFVIGIYEVSSGGTTGTVADPKLIFTAALKLNANSIILCHNHPSGNLTPSEEDMKLTQKIKEAGKLLDLDVLDHMIISTEGYYSFSDEGRI
jgi:DNA repair protein RadC